MILFIPCDCIKFFFSTCSKEWSGILTYNRLVMEIGPPFVVLSERPEEREIAP